MSVNAGADGCGEAEALSRAMEAARAELSIATDEYRAAAGRADNLRAAARKASAAALRRPRDRRHVGMAGSGSVVESAAAAEQEVRQAKLRLDAARARIQELRRHGFAGVISPERLRRRGELRSSHLIAFTSPRSGACTSHDCDWSHDEASRTNIFVDYLRHIAAIEIDEHDSRRVTGGTRRLNVVPN
jgi:hypothetical protein